MLLVAYGCGRGQEEGAGDHCEDEREAEECEGAIAELTAVALTDGVEVLGGGVGVAGESWHGWDYLERMRVIGWKYSGIVSMVFCECGEIGGGDQLIMHSGIRYNDPISSHAFLHDNDILVHC